MARYDPVGTLAFTTGATRPYGATGATHTPRRVRKSMLSAVRLPASGVLNSSTVASRLWMVPSSPHGMMYSPSPCSPTSSASPSDGV